MKKGLIVSCQALEDEPLHSSYIMSKMATAAVQEGAIGIRANGVNDILEIKKCVSVPIIGIIKKNYNNSDVYITPTMKEINMLVECGVDVIAMDATKSKRPNNESLYKVFKKAKDNYPNQKFMADCSTYEEALKAYKMGFDYIGTTLIGYTNQSLGRNIADDDFHIVKKLLPIIGDKLIVEGNIDIPEKARRVVELGCNLIVVGSAITRPQVITRKFIKAINLEKE